MSLILLNSDFTVSKSLALYRFIMTDVSNALPVSRAILAAVVQSLAVFRVIANGLATSLAVSRQVRGSVSRSLSFGRQIMTQFSSAPTQSFMAARRRKRFATIGDRPITQEVKKSRMR